MDVNQRMTRWSGAFTEEQIREILSLWEMQAARRRKEEEEREEERRRQRRRLVAVSGGTAAIVLSLVVGLAAVTNLGPRRALEAASVQTEAADPAPKRVLQAASVPTTIPSPPAVTPAVELPRTVAAARPVVEPVRAVAPARPAVEPARATTAQQQPVIDVPAPLTPIEIAGAKRRVQRLEQEATTAEIKAELHDKRSVAETWIQTIGYDAALVKARRTARAFLSQEHAAKVEKGPAAQEVLEAAALVKYWRDVSDLIIIASPLSSRS